ncbi:hypothetical protein ACQU0X_27000 [Pseudovibrio ascidiaceicola]|uniref:hypothetical protein n=1 Tax=Pseudovibrio ascidiaceicola TaxID=285279 RepID=UPI003D361DD1
MMKQLQLLACSAAVGILLPLSAIAHEGAHHYVISDVDRLEDIGFEYVQFVGYHDAHNDIYNRVVAPDYLDETGKIADTTAFKLAFRDFTGDGTAELLIKNRHPGYCDGDGCVVQIYQLVNGRWEKRLQKKVRSLLVDKNSGNPPVLALAGSTQETTSYWKWKNNKFVELQP